MKTLKGWLLLLAAPLIAVLWALREMLLPKRKSEARAQVDKLQEAVKLQHEARLNEVHAKLESIRQEREEARAEDPVDLANEIIKRN